MGEGECGVGVDLRGDCEAVERRRSRGRGAGEEDGEDGG